MTQIRKKILFILLAGTGLFLQAQPKTDQWLETLVRSKASPLLLHVLNYPDSFQYQLIYTEINRDKNNYPHFRNHYLHVDRNQYFNPASTVKLPTALMALEKLNGLRKPGVSIFNAMLTDSSYNGQTAVFKDSSSETGLPSIANYLRKIFLVSDNDAYNRLYEWNGQDYLNESLWKKGFINTRIVRRFVTMNEEENRHTNAIILLNGKDTVVRIPAHYSQTLFDYSKQVLAGKAHYNRYDSLILAPMDFTRHNNLPLEELQAMLQTVLFPQSVPEAQRFRIDSSDRQFLLRYMSELPSESRHPHYDSAAFFDSYCKFFLYKSGKQRPPSHIRIFNKPGWSYGYLTDAAYIVDFATGTELMLGAVIYVNRDGVLNDDKYEYQETGYPFFKEIGEILLEYDRARKRKIKPDLSAFRLDYTEQ